MLKNIYTWAIALFFLVNAISATAKVSLWFEAGFIIILFAVIYSIRKNERVYDMLLDRNIVLPACMISILAYFLIYFPPNTFNAIPFHEDFTQFFTLSLNGIDTLRHGSVFGWNSQMLGGYYTIADIVSNKAFFLAPFLIFGSRAGFHLMILFFVFLFPILCNILLSLNTKNEQVRSISMILSTTFLFYFFRSILHTGTLDSLMGVDCFLLNMIAAELLFKGKRYSSFILALTMSISFYAHLGIFLMSAIFIFFALLSSKEKGKYFTRLAITAFFVSLMTIHFTHFFLTNNNYFIFDNSRLSPANVTIAAITGSLIASLKELLPIVTLQFAPHELAGIVFIFLPIGFWVWGTANENGSPKKYYLMMATAFILSFFGRSAFQLIFQSLNHVLPIFIVFSVSFWLYATAKHNKYAVAIVLLSLPIILTPFPGPFPHISSLYSYNKALMSRVNKMDGNLILLETRSTWNLLDNGEKKTDFDPLRIHAESLFPYETGKDFFTYYTEGYSHSRFRGNAINSGTYMGKMISRYPISTFNDLMKKWGIRYLILWSNTSTKYFSAYPDHYQRMWSDKNWVVFRYLNADTRSVVTASGSGTLINKDPFEKQIILRNVAKNDEIIIRSNYLKQWQFSYPSSRVKLYEKNGQIAFKAPHSGSYTVKLAFPKYYFLSFIAFSAMISLFLLSYFRLL